MEKIKVLENQSLLQRLNSFVNNSQKKSLNEQGPCELGTIVMADKVPF